MCVSHPTRLALQGLHRSVVGLCPCKSQVSECIKTVLSTVWELCNSWGIKADNLPGYLHQVTVNSAATLKILTHKIYTSIIIIIISIVDTKSIISRDRLINGFRFYCRDNGKWVALLSPSVSRRCDTCTVLLSTLPATDDSFRGGKTIGERTRVTVRLYAIFCAYLAECQFIILPLLCADMVLLLTFWKETIDSAFSYKENW